MKGAWNEKETVDSQGNLPAYFLTVAAVLRFQNEPEQPSGGRQQEETGWQEETGQQEENGSQEETQIAYTFRTSELLTDHFERHGREMGFDSEEAYVQGANHVVLSPDALHKLEKEDGDDVYFLEATNELVIVSSDGYIRTYFCPEDGIDYYNRQ